MIIQQDEFIRINSPLETAYEDSVSSGATHFMGRYDTGFGVMWSPLIEVSKCRLSGGYDEYCLLIPKRDINIIYAQQDINITGDAVFLAGPTPRSKDVLSWRPKFIEDMIRRGFKGTILIPEFEDPSSWTENFAYDKQIEWEMEAMDKADTIVFWIPRELPDMPAFTTNTEFGYWIAKDPSKINLGIPSDAVKCDYIKHLAKDNNIVCHNTTTDVIGELTKSKDE